MGGIWFHSDWDMYLASTLTRTTAVSVVRLGLVATTAGRFREGPFPAIGTMKAYLGWTLEPTLPGTTRSSLP